MADTPADRDSNPDFSPVAIRRRLPTKRFSEDQTRALIASIRNPDARIPDIADKAGVSNGTVTNALDLAVIVTGSSPTIGVEQNRGAGAVAALQVRGTHRRAQTYTELTPKQKAIIDFVARNPAVEDEERDYSYMDVGRMVMAHDKYDVEFAPSYAGEIVQKYDGLIRERRLEYLADGRINEDIDGAGPEDYAGPRADPGQHFTTPRMALEPAGYALPDRNLDGLDEHTGRRMTPAAIAANRSNAQRSGADPVEAEPDEPDEEPSQDATIGAPSAEIQTDVGDVVATAESGSGTDEPEPEPEPEPVDEPDTTLTPAMSIDLTAADLVDSLDPDSLPDEIDPKDVSDAMEKLSRATGTVPTRISPGSVATESPALATILGHIHDLEDDLMRIDDRLDDLAQTKLPIRPVVEAPGPEPEPEPEPEPLPPALRAYAALDAAGYSIQSYRVTKTADDEHTVHIDASAPDDDTDHHDDEFDTQ